MRSAIGPSQLPARFYASCKIIRWTLTVEENAELALVIDFEAFLLAGGL